MVLGKVKSWFITFPECQTTVPNYAARKSANNPSIGISQEKLRHSPGRGIVAFALFLGGHAQVDGDRHAHTYVARRGRKCKSRGRRPWTITGTTLRLGASATVQASLVSTHSPKPNRTTSRATISPVHTCTPGTPVGGAIGPIGEWTANIIRAYRLRRLQNRAT